MSLLPFRISVVYCKKYKQFSPSLTYATMSQKSKLTWPRLMWSDVTIASVLPSLGPLQAALIMYLGDSHRHIKFPENVPEKRCDCEAQHPRNYRGCAEALWRWRKQRTNSQVPAGRSLAFTKIFSGRIYKKLQYAAGHSPDVITTRNRISNVDGFSDQYMHN
jgi:hypothetical protein